MDKNKDQDIRLDLDTPEEGVAEVSGEETPTDEVVTEEDRMVYNCSPCFGKGLLSNGQICQRCLGTGKV